jgi:deoxyribodipyrimidine photo-lyase
MTIQATRIRTLNKLDLCKGAYVLYWMQQSQRAEYNHALEYAIRQANQLNRPLLVVFGLTENYPEANLRHYAFMLQGLQETQTALAARGIKMVLRHAHPPDAALELGRKASLIVCDQGYLRHQRAWRRQVARNAGCRVVRVESDVVVPVAVASAKAEYAARTLRPKIQRHLQDYLVKLKAVRIDHSSLDLKVRGMDLDRIEALLQRLNLDGSAAPVSRFFRGGTTQAKHRFDDFLQHGLKNYPGNHNQPQTDDVSHMSPYLHFGQVSPLYLALEVDRVSDADRSAKEAFLEELIVRRELAANFTHYTRDYDAYTCIPGWAQETLAAHKGDQRVHRYPQRRLEAADTHDSYWNACMLEMKHTGFMHNHMRMYWGKKILAWSPTPRQAFRTTLAINNKYFLDGRDPNSYAGVAWIYGVHDRAWMERPIFGKVRTMTAAGLERKCDTAAYLKKVAELVKRATE